MTERELDDRDLETVTGGVLSTKWVDVPTRNFKKPEKERQVLQSIEEGETGL